MCLFLYNIPIISPSTAVRDGLVMYHLSRQDTSRWVPSQDRQRSKMCTCRTEQESRLRAGFMRRQRLKEDPLIILPSQDQSLEHKSTLPSSMTNDESELPEHEMQESEDTYKKRKLCLILSRHDLFKTRSVKTHFTMLVSVSHSMSTSPVRMIEYVTSASAVICTEFSPVIEYVSSTSVDTLVARSPVFEYVKPTAVDIYGASSSVIEYVPSASVVFHDTPATLIEHSSL